MSRTSGRNEVLVERTTFDDTRLAIDNLQVVFHSLDRDVQQLWSDIDGYVEDSAGRSPVAERLMDHVLSCGSSVRGGGVAMAMSSVYVGAHASSKA